MHRTHQGPVDDTGIQNQALAKASGLPNPIARLSGDGIAGPLLLQGHIDVVPANPERWQHPPFGGYLVDGFLWGLGSLDMKSGIAMMPHAILRGKTDRMTPGGDIVLATVSDEESGGDQVARYLVADRQELFAGIKYALGEGGGSTQSWSPTSRSAIFGRPSGGPAATRRWPHNTT